VSHRPWLDEWQALQISLQSPNLAALLENLRYEGHPPFWYLILRGAGQLLPPAWVLPAVQLPIALALQSLILFRLPLTRIERLLYSCSAFVLIDYGAIARSQGLGVLLVMTAFLFRHRRAAWIAIAALPMVDFLFGVLSILCLAIYWREKRLWAPGILAWIVVGLAAAWTVRPAPDMIPAFWLNGPLRDGAIELARFGALLLPFAMANNQLVWNETPPLASALVAGVLFIGLGLWLLRRDKLSTVIFGGFVLLIFLFSIFVYPLAIRHVSLAAVILVLLITLQSDLDGRARRPFVLWLAVGAGCGLALAIATLVIPFDTARRAASFITEHNLQSKHWVTYPDSRAQGVSALTGVEFERLERNCTQSFIRWNYRSRIQTVADLEKELDRIARRGGQFFLLTDFDLLVKPLANRAAYRQIAFVPPGIDGQAYFLYQVRPDLPEHGQTLPKCPPSRLPLQIMHSN